MSNKALEETPGGRILVITSLSDRKQTLFSAGYCLNERLLLGRADIRANWAKILRNDPKSLLAAIKPIPRITRSG